MPTSNSNLDSIVFGFTGTKRGMRPRQSVVLSAILMKNFKSGFEFHHGDCIGADVEAAESAQAFGYIIVCHPPNKTKTRGFFRFNDRTLVEADYIVRDHNIVDACTVLIAAPHTNYEITRSGTWTTIRYARKQHKPVWIVFPDGTFSVEPNK